LLKAVFSGILSIEIDISSYPVVGKGFRAMPKITVNGSTFEVEQGIRLVLALEQNGINIGHRCGGKAKCTTCRIEFLDGEPEVMTPAEYSKLQERGLFGQYRLSCQIEVDQDMSLRPIMTAETQPEWNGDTGPTPEPIVEPEAVWYPIKSLTEGSAGI
jgi:ferredoxin